MLSFAPDIHVKIWRDFSGFTAEPSAKRELSFAEEDQTSADLSSVVRSKIGEQSDLPARVLNLRRDGLRPVTISGALVAENRAEESVNFLGKVYKCFCSRRLYISSESSVWGQMIVEPRGKAPFRPIYAVAKISVGDEFFDLSPRTFAGQCLLGAGNDGFCAEINLRDQANIGLGPFKMRKNETQN